MINATLKLDVGGVYFEACSSTLTESIYFKNLVEGPMSNVKQVDGRIFIDRSGALFSHVLQYLRTRKVFTEDKTLLLQLKVEAKFFQLDRLDEAVQDRLDILESEGKEIYRFMNLSELEYIHLDKPPTASSTTLNSVVENTQEVFKVIKVVETYLHVCETHLTVDCNCLHNRKIAHRTPRLLVAKRNTSFP